MKVFDRLSGKQLDHLPSEPVLLGRWLLEPGDEAIHQNDSPVKFGEALIPGIDDRWTIIEPSTGSIHKGNFAPDCFPSEQDLNAFQALGNILLASNKEAEGWLGWCSTSPFAPNLDQAITKHPLEDVIKKELEHLEVVCCRPQTHIRIEAEAVLVSRARKMDRNVYNRLASHTEDWLHRTITGVQPRRVFAQVREEQWDLYENRVAVRLVDHLIKWLRERMNEARRVYDDIFNPLDNCYYDDGMSWRRSYRICELWGEAFDAGQGKAQADQRIRNLENLMHRMLKLMDSVLYRMVPRQAQAPRILRMSNLFKNHDHYRGVARLWQAWSQQAGQQTFSSSVLYKDRQDLLSSYNAWCMLLIMRALNQLEIKPEDDNQQHKISPRCFIQLKNGHSLEWQLHGILVLQKENKPLVRFIPLIHALARLKVNILSEYVDDLVKAVSDVEPWSIILHPKVPNAPSADRIATIDAHPPLPDTIGALDFIEISPFLLDSVERISRAIRWAVSAPNFLAYPPLISPVPDELYQGLAGKLSVDPVKGYRLIQNISQQEMAKVIKATEQAGNQLKEKEQERQQVVDELQTVKGESDRRAELNIQKRMLLPVIDNFKSELEKLTSFQNSLKKASLLLTHLQTCPICSNPNPENSLQSHQNDCFEITCSSCKAVWGLRYVPARQIRIPIILVGELPNGYIPQRVDDILSCDVLSVPVIGENDKIEFLSPRQIPCSITWLPNLLSTNR